jgi:hypothetical protein
MRFRKDYRKPATKVDRPKKIERGKLGYQLVMTKQKKFTAHPGLQGLGKYYLCPALSYWLAAEAWYSFAVSSRHRFCSINSSTLS